MDFEQRVHNLEQACQDLVVEQKKLATFDEIDVVVTKIFGDIEKLKTRIANVRNQLGIIERTIPTTPRKP